MTVHNYRPRQVHETLNGVNPSSGFRDMRSAKSGSNLWQIWQVFGPWASPYGANGQMSMTVHNYRPRQFHRTSNGENPSSGYRDMGSASLAAARPPVRPPARTVTTIPLQPRGLRGKKTYLRIMENIHPNHNPLSKSLMLWSNTNANFRYYHISLFTHMWKQINNISRYCGNHDLISPDHGKHPSESSGTLLVHLSESRARKNNVLFHKLQAAGISVVTESLFGFTKLILHHPRAVTAASRGSTIADLALRITHQPEPYILWSRFTHTLPSQ